mgnify:CR=1 FL=1
MTWDLTDDPEARVRQLSSCAGKSIYLTWAKAHENARKMTKACHDRGDRVYCEPYRCDWGHIHIGTRTIITPPYRKPVRTHRRKGAQLHGYL